MVLSAISQYPSKAFAGLLQGLDSQTDVQSYLNNAGTTQGVYDLVFTAVNTHTYTATIYGIAVSYLSDGSATLAEIRDGVLAAIAAQPALVLMVTSVASGNNVRITEINGELNGPATVTGLDASTALTVVTAHSQTEPLPAGIMVVAGPNFQDCRLPRTNATTALLGVVMHQHAPVSEKRFPAPSTILYPANREIPVVQKGRIWVIVEEAVALTDTPFMRFAAGAGGSQLGAIRRSADTASAVTLAGFAKFRTAQATPGGLALLQINLVP